MVDGLVSSFQFPVVAALSVLMTVVVGLLLAALLRLRVVRDGFEAVSR
jgi:hypothetical protein